MILIASGGSRDVIGAELGKDEHGARTNSPSWRARSSRWDRVARLKGH